MYNGPEAEWNWFQNLVKAGITRGSEEYDYLGELLLELRRCEVVLRSREDGISSLAGPVADELNTAMDQYEKAGSPGNYDEVCAANIVLAAMNALVREARRMD